MDLEEKNKKRRKKRDFHKKRITRKMYGEIIAFFVFIILGLLVTFLLLSLLH